MKAHIRITTTALRTLVDAVKGAAPKKSTMPALQCILFHAEEGGRVEAVATDLDMAVRSVGVAEVIQPGFFALPAQKLAEIVKALPGPTVDIAIQDNHYAHVTAARTVFKVAGHNPEEFPKVPTASDEKRLGVDPALLREMLDRVLYSVSVDETRYVLNGVYCHAKADTLVMASTDGHRLSTCERTLAGASTGITRPVILPRKGLHELRRMLDGGDGDVQLGVTNSFLSAQRGPVTLHARLIEGKYPAYDQVIPSNGDKTVRLSSAILLDGLRRMGIVSSEKSQCVTMVFSKDGLRFSSQNPDLGEAHEEVPVDYAGADLRIGCNGRYLAEAVDHLGADEVELTMSDELSPFLMKPVNGATDVAVVMPMRT